MGWISFWALLCHGGLIDPDRERHAVARISRGAKRVPYRLFSVSRAMSVSMYDSQFILGAILFTFIISRVYFLTFLWVSKPLRLLLANLATLVTVVLLRAHGMAVDSPPDYVEAFTAYLLPVLFWLGFDLYRWRRGGKETQAQGDDPVQAGGDKKP